MTSLTVGVYPIVSLHPRLCPSAMASLARCALAICSSVDNVMLSTISGCANQSL